MQQQPTFADYGQAWQQGGLPFAPAQKPTGLVDNLVTGAGNIGSGIGKARADLFGFLGTKPNGQANMQRNQAAGQAQEMQGQSMQNPQQNQMALQFYQQMMQNLKQKRGF